MKKFIVGLSIVFAFSLVSYSQIQNSPCPVIAVNGPAMLVTAGDSVKFTAVFEKNSSESKFSYEWTISGGTIIAGQGTSEILVATTSDMESTNLEAKVLVTGLEMKCKSEYSETAVIAQQMNFCIFDDSYGKTMSIFDEFLRLDHFFIRLQNYVGSRGYIHFAIEKSEDKSKVKTRISKLLGHVDFRKVDRNLVSFDLCYEEENRTTFLLVLDGVEFPDSSKCEKVDIDLK